MLDLQRIANALSQRMARGLLAGAAIAAVVVVAAVFGMRTAPTAAGDKTEAGPAANPAVMAQAQAQPEERPAAPSDGRTVAYVFAKASPLLVFDSPALTGGRKEAFDFGKPYEATEQSSQYFKIKLAGGKTGYVRAAHVTSVSSPRWLATTPAFQRSERAKLSFWESTVKLNEFLSGTNTETSKWDYEEYFDAAPNFDLSLPIVETDTLDLLGGSRQVRVVSVMLPIPREIHQAFDKAKTGVEKKIDLHLLLDVSGSTKDFLEPAMAGLIKAFKQAEWLKQRLGGMSVATFGISRNEKSLRVGAVPLDALERAVWHRQGVNPLTDGDREPLVDGLVEVAGGVKPDPARSPVLLVLSGADVDVSATVASAGKTMSVEDVDLKFSDPSSAIFAQVTPEPGDDLRNASRRLRNVSSVRYVDFSDSIADDIVSELRRSVEGQKITSIDPAALVPVSKVAHRWKMMAVLPRNLSPTSSLPAWQSYSAESDWYTVRLWITLDGLILKETTTR